jgi:hypothetical protein
LIEEMKAEELAKKREAKRKANPNYVEGDTEESHSDSHEDELVSPTIKRAVTPP